MLQLASLLQLQQSGDAKMTVVTTGLLIHDALHIKPCTILIYYLYMYHVHVFLLVYKRSPKRIACYSCTEIRDFHSTVLATGRGKINLDGEDV
jgi:hypothetical protein